VTLCREDEIINLDKVIGNLNNLSHKLPIKIKFRSVERFCENKGLYMPAAITNNPFKKLRRQVLKGIDSNPRDHQPHITIIHPRNGTCTDAIFNEICHQSLPKMLVFDCISLIKQCDGGKWAILKEFHLSKTD